MVKLGEVYLFLNQIPIFPFVFLSAQGFVQSSCLSNLLYQDKLSNAVRQPQSQQVKTPKVYFLFLLHIHRSLHCHCSHSRTQAGKVTPIYSIFSCSGRGERENTVQENSLRKLQPVSYKEHNNSIFISQHKSLGKA